MLKVAILAGSIAAITSLHATAETETDYSVGTWGASDPAIGAYQPRSSGLPLTGAARLGADQGAGAGGLMPLDMTGASTYRDSYGAGSGLDYEELHQSFGPGPELVAPTPSPVFELRRR